MTIYPQWRGYEFILVHGRYLIVQPETHEIVYIIEGWPGPTRGAMEPSLDSNPAPFRGGVLRAAASRQMRPVDGAGWARALEHALREVWLISNFCAGYASHLTGWGEAVEDVPISPKDFLSAALLPITRPTSPLVGTPLGTLAELRNGCRRNDLCAERARNLNLLGTREPRPTAMPPSPTSRSCARTPRASSD